MQPQLPVTDLDRAMAFHRSLGMDVDSYEGGDYAFVKGRGREVWHLRAVVHIPDGASGAALYAHVRDPEALREEFASRGLEPTEVVTEAWGMKEFSVTDPDGNLLRFGTNVDT